ncbi:MULTISPECIES: sodium-dependent transporter [unclassified Oscillibacter]|uniref:sodium-dependent transporter n=1 Tax=unclassified Oscillibacter TaxID=2629304 RepID=UPI0025E8D6B3|nr:MULTISPECIES: sodium-dependent transporter [unclassified Oscillibacter]
MAENSKTLEKQDGFKSQWGFIMAAVGSCVGMANVWRFPMLVSRYGGLTFLIPYFIFAFIISQSGMMEEFSLGRWSGFGPVGSFGKAMENGGRSKKIGELIGSVPVFASLCLGTGYAVIMGWVFYYAKMALTGELVAMGQDMNVIGSTFGAVAPEAATLPEAIKMTFATGGANNFWIIVAIAVSFLIMILGVSGGIEASCKVMIPALYVLFIILAAVMIFIPGTGDGYRYIFTLDPKGLLNPEVWVFAFGQCFFSLSVAGSGSVIYGSYLGKDVKIRQSAALCAVFDTSAALLAMLIIIPAMATVGADLGNGGPGLLFIYILPVFNSMGGISRIIGIFFYVAVLFAGISSIINLFETPVAMLQEKLHVKRLTATAAIHIFALIVSLIIQPWTSQWMDMVSIYLCPLGAFTAGFMFFWVMKKDTAIEAVQLGSEKPIMKWFYSFGKYVFVPLCLLCFILGIGFGGIS